MGVKFKTGQINAIDNGELKPIDVIIGSTSESGSSVSVDQVLTAGTEIGGVTIDGTRTALYAPNGSGEGGTSGTTIHKALNSNGTTETTEKGSCYGVAAVTTSGSYNYAKWYCYLDTEVTELSNGMIIAMTIPYTGSSYGTCISIDGNDFHPVCINNSKYSNTLSTKTEILLMYDSGSSLSAYVNGSPKTIAGVWRLLTTVDTDTNTTLSGIATCTTSSTTAAKTATLPGFSIYYGQSIILRFDNTNTVASALTLNVNSTGAKTIYIDGTITSTTNYYLNAGYYFANNKNGYWDLTRIYFTDTTYSFDGTYNSSTNKAATVSTVTTAVAGVTTDSIGALPLTGGTVTGDLVCNESSNSADSNLISRNNSGQIYLHSGKNNTDTNCLMASNAADSFKTVIEVDQDNNATFNGLATECLSLNGGATNGNIVIQNSSGESNVFVKNLAGGIWLYSHNDSTGSRGIWCNNASGTDSPVITIDQDNSAIFYGNSSGLTDSAKETIASEIYETLMTGEW